MLTIDWNQKYFLGGSLSKEAKNQRKKRKTSLTVPGLTKNPDHIPAQAQEQNFHCFSPSFHSPCYQLEIIKSPREAFIFFELALFMKWSKHLFLFKNIQQFCPNLEQLYRDFWIRKGFSHFLWRRSKHINSLKIRIYAS